MTEEIIIENAFHLCQRLEQENKELKEFCIELEKQKEKQHNQWFERCTEINVEASQYRSVLEEISGLASPHCTQCSQIINIINEVLK